MAKLKSTKPADKPCGNLDVADFQHGIQSLIFLKYISYGFAETRAGLQKEKGVVLEERARPMARVNSTERRAKEADSSASFRVDCFCPRACDMHFI